MPTGKIKFEVSKDVPELKVLKDGKIFSEGERGIQNIFIRPSIRELKIDPISDNCVGVDLWNLEVNFYNKLS